MLATNRPEVAAVRAAVPEFEDAFQRELAEEDGEMGPFQAMSLFARWADQWIREDGSSDVIARATDVIARLRTDAGLQLGDALAAEFLEAAAQQEQLAPYLRERGMLL